MDIARHCHWRPCTSMARSRCLYSMIVADNTHRSNSDFAAWHCSVLATFVRSYSLLFHCNWEKKASHRLCNVIFIEIGLSPNNNEHNNNNKKCFADNGMQIAIYGSDATHTNCSWCMWHFDKHSKSAVHVCDDQYMTSQRLIHCRCIYVIGLYGWCACATALITIIIYVLLNGNK